MAAAPTTIGADSSISPEEVLEALTGLLGANYLKDDSATPLQKSSYHDWSLIPWEPVSSPCSDDDDDEGPVFSSFPSLSLERRAHASAELDSSGLAASSSHQHRQDIEARVASLLSRPILVSSSNPNDSTTNSSNDDELLPEEGDDDCEFMAAAVADVPTMMLHNFFNSFSTLMNSRLRAYATFLARHGLALFSESSDDELAEEGIVGVEQKLETMLEIGRLMSTSAIVTAFHGKKNEAQTTPMDNDDGTLQVTMPIEMVATIDITLPSPSEGPNEVVTVSLRTSGSVTGIFSTASKTKFLRVVQVDLNMSELLPSMIDKASEIISQIVEMTNSLYSLALPRFDDAQGMMQPMKIPSSPMASPVREGDGRPTNERKRATLVEEEDVAVVSPGLNPSLAQPGSPLMPDFQLLDDSNHDGSFLSRESCESLVDYVFNDTNETVLSPPKKKAKLVPFETASALPAVS